MASFYRKFIRKFSGICAPFLETMNKEKQPFKWTIAEEKGFKILKEKIPEKLVLALPDFIKVFFVRCGASGYAIGGVLSQDDKPIAYFSEKLNEAK